MELNYSNENTDALGTRPCLRPLVSQLIPAKARPYLNVNQVHFTKLMSWRPTPLLRWPTPSRVWDKVPFKLARLAKLSRRGCVYGHNFLFFSFFCFLNVANFVANTRCYFVRRIYQAPRRRFVQLSVAFDICSYLQIQYICICSLLHFLNNYLFQFIIIQGSCQFYCGFNCGFTLWD